MVLLCLGENLERKRERICPEKCSKMFCFFFFFEGFEGGLGVFISFFDPSISISHLMATGHLQRSFRLHRAGC